MKPHDFEDLLEGYLNGTLTPQQQERLQEILATCETCRQEFQEAQTLEQWLREAPRVAPPPGLRTAILQRLQKRSNPWLLRWAPALAPVALALLVLLGGLWWGHRSPQPLEAHSVTVDLLAPEPEAALLLKDFLVVGAVYPSLPYEVEVLVDSTRVPYRNIGGEGYFVLKDLPVSPGYHQVTVVIHLPTLHQTYRYHRQVYLVASGGESS